MGQLEDLRLQHSFLELGDDFHSRVQPQPLRNAYLIHGNADVAALLDLDSDTFTNPTFVKCFNGERTHPSFAPLAMAYSGHQFGSYVPQLGDGRAMLLGEVANETGHWDIVSKGSGLTPYSRFADGRAVLRSSIREYLCSAAMTGLGIPSSQALCLIGSEEPVQRERTETGALVVRVAESHIRFGSFEYFSHTNQHEALKALVDYTIKRNFPELASTSSPISGFIEDVVRRTAKLMARWQSIAFTHGVMNTDNMSIIGDTFDYGPFAFMDAFQPNHVPNHSDQGGRYAFNQQPGIGLWNCRALAYALKPLLQEDQAKESLDHYETIYRTEYNRLMAAKFGIVQQAEQVPELWQELAGLLTVDEVDYTHFFRQLCNLSTNELEQSGLFNNKPGFEKWLTRYKKLLENESDSEEERSQRMKQVNPKYILRSYLAEAAIRKAEDYRDHSAIEELMSVLRNPFDEHPQLKQLADLPPDWSKHLELSCSS